MSFDKGRLEQDVRYVEIWTDRFAADESQAAVFLRVRDVVRAVVDGESAEWCVKHGASVVAEIDGCGADSAEGCDRVPARVVFVEVDG